jgi:hypothetical protein
VATRRWRTTIDGTTYDVEARTSVWTGAIKVLVNGTELVRGPRLRNTTRRIIFPLGRHVATLVSMTYGRGSTYYDLVVDGRSVTTGVQARPPVNPYESLAVSWMLLVGVVAILGGLLWFGALPEIRLASEGREAPARVTGARVSSGRSTNYYLRYQFIAANGATNTAEGRVSYATYQSVHVGDLITVVYVPSAPEIQRPASFDERIWLVGLVAMFGGMLPYTAVMVRRASRLRSITSALASRAIRATATVEKTSKKFLGQETGQISYRYNDVEGRVHRGRSPDLYVEEAAAYGPGSSAMIAYDPNDAGNSMWLGAADPNAMVWVTGAG